MHHTSKKKPRVSHTHSSHSQQQQHAQEAEEKQQYQHHHHPHYQQHSFPAYSSSSSSYSLSDSVPLSSSASSSSSSSSSSCSSSSSPCVGETVTVSTLTCLIERQFTIRKTEAERLTDTEKKSLVPVHVRILQEKKVTGESTSRSPSPSPSPCSSSSVSVCSSCLFIPATDLGPLLNVRKNNVPGYLSKYSPSLRQQMMVDCPRAAGGIARVQLNVLTLEGAQRFIMTSRSKQAEKVWAWIQQQTSKYQQQQQQATSNDGHPPSKTNRDGEVPFGQASPVSSSHVSSSHADDSS